MSGSYFSLSGDLSWPIADQVLWLDVGLRSVIPRILHRSWTRYRRNELLWGTNRERFWSQLKIWDEHESLIGYAIRRSGEKRRGLEDRMADLQWSHIDFVRLRGQKAIDAWVTEALRVSAPDRSREPRC